MQEAQALAEIPLEETLVSETSSSGKGEEDEEGEEGSSGNEYDSDADKAEVER